ncbi:MAG TPA: signal peptide peptidase SppA [Methylomirabilota bacterium]|jgi:protease-4|nr:signal peptide peptidase SppA [Methylomirabilota bacterium]
MGSRIVSLVLASLAIAGCSVISLDLTPRVRPLQETTIEGKGRDKVLLVDLAGVLAEEPIFTLEARPQVPLLARVREELEKAAGDSQVRAVVLRINSPGGTVTASDILYHEITRFKARRKIPVIASILDVGASGGYYAALAADRIVAHPTTVTGSIGVLMLTVNSGGLLEKIGVSASYIKSGPLKDMGNPFRALTPEERAIFQDVIDRLYARFVTLVARERRLDEARVRSFADGRIYTATEALSLGLVDQIGYLEDAIGLAREAAGVPDAKVIAYHRPRQYRATIYSASETPGSGAGVADLARLVTSGPRFLYLWWP